jgi:hypothetical protein
VLVAALGLIGPRLQASSSSHDAAYARPPEAFVENQGQVDARVRFYAQGARYAFYVTDDGVVMSFMDERATSGHALALSFPNSDPKHNCRSTRTAPC